MAELQFFTGTMDSGKSTLALQTNHNHAARGRAGEDLRHAPRRAGRFERIRVGMLAANKHDVDLAGRQRSST